MWCASAHACVPSAQLCLHREEELGIPGTRRYSAASAAAAGAPAPHHGSGGAQLPHARRWAATLPAVIPSARYASPAVPSFFFFFFLFLFFLVLFCALAQAHAEGERA
eukprot:COSAG01_NODE_36_length_34092_cov_26.350032_25_plen_108_part_00